MPSRERVQTLISYVEQRREVEAIREFYAADAQTQENNAPPTVGLAALVEKEERFLASLAAMHVAEAASFVVEGDQVAINWIFEFSYPNGQRMRMDEIAYQLWEGDKIVRERYYYDTALLRA
jgi:ketosteroid isomerase-like protein